MAERSIMEWKKIFRWPWKAYPREEREDHDRFNKASMEALDRRHHILAEGGFDASDIVPGALGLALSGGGIRSATISVGAIQALAFEKRLLDFDYVSTVSGGGYAGSFLVSLFLPTAARGLDGKAQLIDRTGGSTETKLALDALRLGTYESEMSVTDRSERRFKIRSPIWWLREHSRYLAPNGATDYATALTYYVRAWLAMVYVFALPIFVLAIAANRAGVFVLASAPEQALQTAQSWLIVEPEAIHLLLSPLLALALLLLFLSVSAGLAYWQTEWLPRVIGKSSRLKIWQRLSPKLWFALSIATTLGAILGVAGRYRDFLIQVLAGSGGFPAKFLAWGLALAVASQFFGLMVFLKLLFKDSADFTAGIRSAVTRLGTTFNIGFVVVGSLGIVDTIAIFLQSGEFSVRDDYAIATGTIVPAIAWLINWFVKTADGAGGVRKVLAQFLSPIALALGIILFASLAVGVDLLMYRLVYPDIFGIDEAQWRPSNLDVILPIVTTLLVATGVSTGFINLSSLHNLYASRLTRAYLGGTNIERLKDVADEDRDRPITQTHVNDDIEISIYQRQRTAAPLHLINVTLNETLNRESSQIVERDRKGVPIVFGPEGILVDAARCARGSRHYFHDWDEVKRRKVEPLSVGQLCAISGAAASSGMGANTTLGTSLIMSFANIRLGYWWWAGDLLKQPVRLLHVPLSWIYLKLTGLIRTYFYLFNEMTARYSRDYARLYLSDGGHFENSGVYELLRRGVKVILALDNGADPDLAFADLENLVRKARIDLGLSVNVAPVADVIETFGEEGAALFLNGYIEKGRDKEWREVAHADGGSALGLLLNVYRSAERPKSGEDDDHVPCQRIVWLKPRCVADLPPDIDGYAVANDKFPQQSTGDQFFTEAQWESYRGLGYCYIRSLFGRTKNGEDVLRSILGTLSPFDPLEQESPKRAKPRRSSSATHPPG
jgi:hypothetical protein